jgi:hypothetical protein
MIETRARCAAGTRSHARAKQCQPLDRKIRSIDSYYQSTMTQPQKQWSLPFANRHHRSLLPQFNFSASGGGAVVSCVRGVGGLAVSSRRTMVRRHKIGCRHIAPELVFKASNARGVSGACWNAAGQQFKSCRPWEQGLGQVKRQRETVV